MKKHVKQFLQINLVNSYNNFNENVVYNVDNPPQLNGNKINLKEFIKSYNKKLFIECNKYVFESSDSPQLKRCFQNILDKAALIENLKKPKNQNSSN